MAGKKFISQASQGNTKPSASNVAQGGTDFGRASVQDRKTIRGIGDVKNIINQRSGASGSELIAQQASRYGLSQSDVQRLQQSSAQIASKQSQLVSQARSIEQQAAAKQAQIKAAQLAKKNEDILRQIQEIKGASDRVGLSNISSKQRMELRANYSQKISELNSQLTRNRKQQVDILDIGIAKSSSIASESSQRRQQSAPAIRQGTAIRSDVFSFTPGTSLKGPVQSRARPERILENAFNEKNQGRVQGPSLNFSNTFAFTLPAGIGGSLSITGEKKEKGPLPTLSKSRKGVEDFFGFESPQGVKDFTKAFDDEFELEVEPRQRSDKPRAIPGVDPDVFSLPSNRRVAGFAAPLANFGATIFDYGSAVVGKAQGKDTFTSDKTTGLPVPKNKTPLQETALSQLFETGKVDTKDPFIRASGFGEAASLGLGLFGVKPVSKGSARIGETIATRSNQKNLLKIVPEPPKTRRTSEVFGEFVDPTSRSIKGKTVGPESTQPAKIPLTLENTIGAGLQSNKVRVRKLRSDLFELESTNPSADKFVFARAAGGNQFEFITLQKNNPITSPRKAGVIGKIGKQDQLFNDLTEITRSKKGERFFESLDQPSDKLLGALNTGGLQEFGRVRTFTSKQVQENPKEFGRFLFGESTALDTTPVKPVSDILFTKSRGKVRGDNLQREIKFNERIQGSRPKDFEENELNKMLGFDSKTGRGKNRQTSILDEVTKKEAQTFAKTITPTKQVRQDAFGTIPFNEPSSQKSSFDVVYSQFTTPKSQKRGPKTTGGFGFVPPQTGGLFDLRTTTRQKNDIGLDVIPNVKQTQLPLDVKLDVYHAPKQDQIPLLDTPLRELTGTRTGNKIVTRQEERQKQRTIQDSLFTFNPTPSQEKPPKGLGGFGSLPPLFGDIGYGGLFGRKSRGKTRFELNTALNAFDPLSSTPKGYGDIFATRSNESLEFLDSKFVKASKKTAKQQSGIFNFANTEVLNVRGKKGINLIDFDIFGNSGKKSKRKKTNDIFDFGF